MGGKRSAPMMQRIIGAVALVSAVFGVTGCYTLQVAQGSSIPNGTQVALDITDAGRVALAGMVGPEISQVEGRLISKENDAYLISVAAVKLLRGGEQVWKGERISIQTNFVSRVYERRLSRGRTIAASATGAGAVLFIVTRALDAAGQGDAGVTGPDSTQSLRRPVRP